MPEKKCPCLVVYNHRLGERLSGSGSQSDKYVVERAMIDCVKSAYDGTLSINNNRCVTLPNGITGIWNTDIPSLTDSEFLIVFDEPIKNLSLDGKPGPYEDVDYTTIHSIKFDINQVSNILRFSAPDAINSISGKGSIGYWLEPASRQFMSAALGSHVDASQTGYDIFDPLTASDLQPFTQIDTSGVGATTLLMWKRYSWGGNFGPPGIQRTGDLKILVKFGLTLGAKSTAADSALKFSVGYVDENLTFQYQARTNMAWNSTRGFIAGEGAVDFFEAPDRRHYQGQFIYNTVNDNDAPLFNNSEYFYTEKGYTDGFSLIRPLALRIEGKTGGAVDMFLTDLWINYKWVY